MWVGPKLYAKEPAALLDGCMQSNPCCPQIFVGLFSFMLGSLGLVSLGQEKAKGLLRLRGKGALSMEKSMCSLGLGFWQFNACESKQKLGKP